MWDRVGPASAVDEVGMKLAVYGRNGTGKTTLSVSFPKPLLAVSFDGVTAGNRLVYDVPGVDVFVPAGRQEAMDLAAGAAGRGYKTVVVDTATSLQELVLKEICGWSDAPVQLGWGSVTQHQYRDRAEQTKLVLRRFLDLPLHVVVLAQEKDHTPREGDRVPGDDLISAFVGLDLGGSTAAWVSQNVDYVCQTFVREGTERVTQKVAGKDVTQTRKTGRPEFCLRTAKAHPVYAAKMRAGRDVDLPSELVDPSFDKIEAILRGETVW